MSTFRPPSLPVKASMSALLVISAWIARTAPSLSCRNCSLFAARHFAFTSASWSALRAVITTFTPQEAKRMAVDAPIPADAPVISARSWLDTPRPFGLGYRAYPSFPGDYRVVKISNCLLEILQWEEITGM